jgi:hypothetical protein
VARPVRTDDHLDMTPDEFVQRLYDSTIRMAEGEADFFADPPGRSPFHGKSRLREVTEFIRGLDDEQREALNEFATLVATRALMGVLYSLDGIGTIVDDPVNERWEIAMVGPNGRHEMLPLDDAPGELGDIARALETTRWGL